MYLKFTLFHYYIFTRTTGYFMICRWSPTVREERFSSVVFSLYRTSLKSLMEWVRNLKRLISLVPSTINYL